MLPLDEMKMKKKVPWNQKEQDAEKRSRQVCQWTSFRTLDNIKKILEDLCKKCAWTEDPILSRLSSN